MKKILLLSSSTFIVGICIGYAVWHTEPQEQVFASSPKMEISEPRIQPDADHLKEIEFLKKEIRRLELASTQKVEKPSSDEVEKQTRMSLIESIINGENDSPAQAEFDEKKFLKKIKNLNLTPEQMSIAERLWDKHMQQMRLTLQARGLLSEKEKEELFSELRKFDFDSELKMVLTEEQINSYEGKRNQELTGVGKMMSAKFFADYGISTDSGFSVADQASVEKAVTQAFIQNDGKLDIPEPIQNLELDPLQKRVLASCYVNLPQELFEKIYNQMVEEETVAP